MALWVSPLRYAYSASACFDSMGAPASFSACASSLYTIGRGDLALGEAVLDAIRVLGGEAIELFAGRLGLTRGEQRQRIAITARVFLIARFADRRLGEIVGGLLRIGAGEHAQFGAHQQIRQGIDGGDARILFGAIASIGNARAGHRMGLQ